MISSINHVAVKTADEERSVRFYLDVLGMQVTYRPPFPFPGTWVGTEDGAALVHLYTGETGVDAQGRAFVGSAAVDHFAVNAKGFHEYRRRLAAAGLDWREQAVPETRLWQLFVYDPNGVMVELLFDGAQEEGPVPTIDERRQYRPGENFFQGAAS